MDNLVPNNAYTFRDPAGATEDESVESAVRMTLPTAIRPTEIKNWIEIVSSIPNYNLMHDSYSTQGLAPTSTAQMRGYPKPSFEINFLERSWGAYPSQRWQEYLCNPIMNNIVGYDVILTFVVVEDLVGDPTGATIDGVPEAGVGVDADIIIHVASTSDFPTIGQSVQFESDDVGVVTAIDSGAKKFNVAPPSGSDWSVLGHPLNGEEMIYLTMVTYHTATFAKGNTEPTSSTMNLEDGYYRLDTINSQPANKETFGVTVAVTSDEDAYIDDVLGTATLVYQPNVVLYDYTAFPYNPAGGLICDSGWVDGDDGDSFTCWSVDSVLANGSHLSTDPPNISLPSIADGDYKINIPDPPACSSGTAYNMFRTTNGIISFFGLCCGDE